MLRRRSAPVVADRRLRPQLAALTRPGRRRSRPRTGDKPRRLAVRGLRRHGRRHPSGFLPSYKPRVAAVLDGLNAASLGLMAGVSFDLGRAALIDPLTVVLALVAFALLLRTNLNSAWLVIGGGLVAVLAKLL